MSAGLRRRLAAFKKPLTSSPVSDIRVLHSGDERHGEVEEAAFVQDVDDVLSDSLSRSYSSVSSGSGPVEDDSEHEPEQDAEKNRRMNGPASNAQEDTSMTPTQSPKPEGKRHVPPSTPLKSPPPAVRRGTTSPRPLKRTRGNSGSSSGSWLGYDLSIIVALVSPIGNILTGSDHIKNILLLLFLIYYLHQLVEVPWNLYLMSLPSEELFAPSEITDAAILAAHSQLRSLEIFYLVLTVLSPFLGASLLRYIAIIISGDPASLSWFSTSLFILATGIRPWSHLTERLKNRSRALKAIIEQQDAGEDADGGKDSREEIDREMSDLREKFDLVDKRLMDLDVSTSREWDDLADAIDSVELTFRKHKSESDKKAKEWDARIGVLETYVLDMHRRDKKTRIHEKETYLRGAKLRETFWEVLALPWTVAVLSFDLARKIARQLGLATGHAASEYEKGRSAPTTSTPTRGRFHSHTLETIVEEPETQNLDKDDVPANGECGCVGSDSSQTLVAEATSIAKQPPKADVLDLTSTLALQLLHFAFSPFYFFIRIFSSVLELPRSATAQ